MVALAIGVGCRLLTQGTPSEQLVVVTWNVRGHPEKTARRKEWFSEQLKKIRPHLLCVQEIANQNCVNTFLQREQGFSQAVFVDSSDGQDNAIFATAEVAGGGKLPGEIAGGIGRDVRPLNGGRGCFPGALG